MIFKFLRDEDAPRPPLAGRLLGLAVGVFLLVIVLRMATDVVVALLPAVVPLVLLIGIYEFIIRRFRR